MCLCVCVCSSQQLLHACAHVSGGGPPLSACTGAVAVQARRARNWLHGRGSFALSEPPQLGEAVPPAPVPEPSQPSLWRINHLRFKCQYSPFCLLPPVMRMRRRQQILRLCVPSLDCCSIPACRARACAWLGALPRCGRE